MEEDLITRFYHLFWLYLAATMTFLLFIIFLVFIRKNLLRKFRNSRIGWTSYLGILLFVLAAGVFSGMNLQLFVRDYRSVQERDFHTVTGTVVDYDRAVSVGDIATTTMYYDPIVRDSDTGDEIKLDCIGTNRDQTYTFLYLENTRLAVIIPSE